MRKMDIIDHAAGQRPFGKVILGRKSGTARINAAIDKNPPGQAGFYRPDM